MAEFNPLLISSRTKFSFVAVVPKYLNGTLSQGKEPPKPVRKDVRGPTLEPIWTLWGKLEMWLTNAVRNRTCVCVCADSVFIHRTRCAWAGRFALHTLQGALWIISRTVLGKSPQHTIVVTGFKIMTHKMRENLSR